ncbi:uncharacterized protein LOC117176770 [Belonocnema kinseyi]|uniref:uncharacterized protein LOC117176770 n=1 Tax=Belonocnema kinseyi TaxID=2817044 RepID=UPI00143D8113|nr:uncharacterized protein LOC117176770 [Belonocnema kinseyi]
MTLSKELGHTSQHTNHVANELEPHPGYGVIDQREQFVHLNNFYVTRSRDGRYRKINHRDSSLITLNGFIIAILDQTNFMSGLYNPKTHQRVKVNELNLFDVCPLSPEDYRDYPVNFDFQPIISL